MSLALHSKLFTKSCVKTAAVEHRLAVDGHQQVIIRVTPETVTAGLGCLDFTLIPHHPRVITLGLRSAGVVCQFAVSTGNAVKGERAPLDQIGQRALISKSGFHQRHKMVPHVVSQREGLGPW